MTDNVVAHLHFSPDDPALDDLAAMAAGEEDLCPLELRALDPRTGQEVTVLAFPDTREDEDDDELR